MGDEGLNPCECLWGHEMSMRRLLSLLRESQAHCTDTECFETVAGPSNQGAENSFMFALLIIAFVLFMFYMRPRSRTSRITEGPSKPDLDNDFDGFPPAPPTAS